ncbi:unnamed protein product [Heterobilharzia americana]|nr:unnamed protein product [Heterobilharzia americana]
MSNNGNDCLLDDVLLSTRMVNLLLEEDNLTDPLNHDIPVSYLEEGGEIEGFANTTLNNNKIHSSGDNGNNNHSTTNDFFTSGKCKESNLIQSVASTSSLITDNLSSVLATEFVQSF